MNNQNSEENIEYRFAIGLHNNGYLPGPSTCNLSNNRFIILRNNMKLSF